ncbi:hypothetical protein G9A89_022609 [Geosiphon pyriformis]|nr:hypothetical protein G9A89_022609 [Geosiphon pyriformis]
MEAFQVSGDCFYVLLFNGGKCIGQVIDTIVITKVSQEFCFEFIEVHRPLDLSWVVVVVVEVVVVVWVVEVIVEMAVVWIQLLD